jgi:hypothetical protein
MRAILDFPQLTYVNFMFQDAMAALHMVQTHAAALRTLQNGTFDMDWRLQEDPRDDKYVALSLSVCHPANTITGYHAHIYLQ